MPRGDGTGPMKEEEAPDAAEARVPVGLRAAPGWGAEERDRAWKLSALNAEQKHPASAASPAFSRNARNAEALWQGRRKRQMK